MSGTGIALSPVVPVWLVAILLSAGLAALVLQFRALRTRVGAPRSLRLSLLRLAALTLLLAVFLNPTGTMRLERKAMPSLAILLDVSPTMGLPGKDGKGSRLDEARRLLLEGEAPLLKALSERYEVQVYALGETLRPLDGKGIADLTPGDRTADLRGALGTLFAKSVLPVLLSDGSSARSGKPGLSEPFAAIPVGDPEGFKDVWIHSVKAPALAFRGREVRVEVEVRSRGYSQLSVPLSLRQGNRVVTARTAQLQGSPAEAALAFAFTPEELGRQDFALSLPSQAGESSTLNNRFHFSLKVVKDKIRILMMSGHPSPSYRFLRMAFKADPTIDLLSFVILRTPTDILNVPPEEQSLIPVPVETLFSRELSSFDLLILDDFPFHLYVKPAYLEQVRDFVKAGGGLALIGGPDLLDGGRYAGTPVEEALPIAAAAQDDYGREGPWTVKLTRSGRGHPITRLDPADRENGELWKAMAPLDGINRVQAKTSATVLVEAGGDVARPILTVGACGQGRVLVLATDASWKWHMGGVARGQGNWAYNQLMDRTVRWLTRDPSLDPVQLVLPEGAGGIGRRTEVRVRSAGDISREPKPPELSVTDPQGVRVETEVRPSGSPGEYVASFVPEKPGLYRLKAGSPAGAVEETVGIFEAVGDRDGFPEHEKLREIADAAGGTLVPPDGNALPEVLRLAEARESRYAEEKRTALWAHPVPWGLILLLLSGEWYLRRRWGMI